MLINIVPLNVPYCSILGSENFVQVCPKSQNPNSLLFHHSTLFQFLFQEAEATCSITWFQIGSIRVLEIKAKYVHYI